MSAVGRDAASIRAAFRLACLDRNAILLFDRSPAGAWRSFRAALICYPAFLLLLPLRLDEEALGGDLFRVFLAESIAYAIGWAGFPLLMLRVARFLEREDRWLDFVTAYNWAQVLQYALFLGSLVLARYVLPKGIGGNIAQAAVLATLLYGWFVARVSLGIGGVAATMVVLLDLVFTAIVSRIADFLY